ncbi:hypothetical protein BJY01DRAFT_249422 [Aspergillus pseudoustus]|uniref:Uncharacterized protein n=1 Tax=Aspergillus pseudoustus TaxID=1810923 RepID=A0ABR4JQ77_9EURO
MPILLNRSTPSSRFSSPSSTTSPPSSASTRSTPIEGVLEPASLPYRPSEPAKPATTFLFIDSQADHATNKKLRNQKQGFLLKNYHRRKKQASIQRLKAPKSTPSADVPTTNRLQIAYSTSERSTSDDPDATGEHDGWADEREVSGRNPSALRSEMWSLKAFLSQGYVDPFAASAVKMTDSMNLYFHHFRIHTIAACYPLDATRMSQWWWQKAITQPALLQALLFLTAGHQATLESSSGVSSQVIQKSMRDSLHLRGDTLKTLNNIMMDPVRAVAESTTLVVASLVAIEAVDANMEAHGAHMKGLRRLVHLMGGLDKLDHMTLSKIYQSDVKSAALYNTRPVFPVSARWRSEILQDSRLFLTGDALSTPKELATLGTSFFSAPWYATLDPSMKTFLQVMQRLIAYYEHAQLDPSTVMPTDNDLFLVMEHQLLSACYATADPTNINEPLRHTLIIYLNLRVWHFQQFPFMQYMVEYLRASLIEASSYAYLRDEAPELLFWVLVIGSLASQGYKCHRWFLNGLSEVAERLGVREWGEARRVLDGYFYTEQVGERRAEEDLWNEVRLKAAYDKAAAAPDSISPFDRSCSPSSFPNISDSTSRSQQMADPAGLIALGIESCKLIVKFCDGYKSFDDDLDNIKIKAEGLLSTLKLIGSLLTQNAAIQPAIAADITAKVLENEKWINKINDRVAKWSLASQNAVLGDKVRAAGKKISYPFRKGALLDTVKILEGLQMNLHTALLALQIQQASTLAQQTQLIQTVHSLGATTLTTLQHYETGFDKLESAIRNSPSMLQPSVAGEASFTNSSMDGRGAITPMSYLILTSNWKFHGGDIISHFIDLGAVVSDRDIGLYPSLELFMAVLKESEEGFILSDVLHAILKQSTQLLARALARQQNSSTHQADTRLFIKLSMEWPEGLAMLLESNKDLPVEDGMDILDFAIGNNFVLGAECMLAKGTPVLARNITDCRSPEMEKIILDTFISRRKQLLNVAEATLPASMQAELGMQPGYLLDATAWDVYRVLTARGTWVDSALEPLDGESIFHNSDLQTDQMDALYNAGFRDINAIDADGYSPQLKIPFYLIDQGDQIQIPPLIPRTIQKIIWFRNKGAAAHADFKCAQQVYYHFLGLIIIHSITSDAANATTRPLHRVKAIIHDLPIDEKCFFSQIFTKQCYDSCACFCSTSGCTPITVALRYFLKYPWIKDAIPSILQVLICEIDPPNKHTAKAILRLITFTDLALTHTCCRATDAGGYFRIRRFDDEDGDEIHDEEHELIDEFETLLQELSRTYEELNLPLWEYTQGYWCERVRKHLLETGETLSADLLCVMLAKKISSIPGP